MLFIQGAGPWGWYFLFREDSYLVPGGWVSGYLMWWVVRPGSDTVIQTNTECHVVVVKGVTSCRVSGPKGRPSDG